MSFLPHINEPPLRSELNHRRVYSRAPALERFLARMRKPLPLSVGLGKSRCNGNPSSQASARPDPAWKADCRCFSSKVWFALDSPLEGSGFEPSVPSERG